ncbi:MAG: mechanosensitive ion channel family protein [Planctomycetes bacterium]|nr:mechanosensitive ion channel family protein [Planctomycetota bacterium]
MTAAVVSVAAAMAVAWSGDAGPDLDPPIHEPAVAEFPPAPPLDPEAAAEAELRLRREQERLELLREAEDFVASADQKIIATLQGLPYPLNLLVAETFFGIPLWRYAASLGLLFFGTFVTFLVLRWFKRLWRRVETGDPARRWLGLDVALTTLRNPVKLIVPGVLLLVLSHLLVTPYHPDIVWLSHLLIFLGLALYCFDLVGIVDRVYGERIFRSRDRLMDTVRPIILMLARIVILVVAGVHVYQGVTGQTMFSVLAGLGIGGLALALASQETLKNLLGFAAIAFDRAFLVGDPVTIGDHAGIVEHVGLRSTRIRSYNGSSVIVPNATAINSNIVNLNRRPYVRREIRVALSPDNPYEKILLAMDCIREAVGEHEGKVSGLPPVVRFADFEPARFVIQVLFWYDADKPFFWDECSRVNLAICQRLSEAGIRYAER